MKEIPSLAHGKKLWVGPNCFQTRQIPLASLGLFRDTMDVEHDAGTVAQSTNRGLLLAPDHHGAGS